jgi:hypothetical protein
MINLQLVWSGDKRIRDVRLAAALGFEHPKRIRCWIALNKAYLRTQGDLVTDTNEPKAYLLNEHQALLAIMQAKTPMPWLCAWNWPRCFVMEYGRAGLLPC